MGLNDYVVARNPDLRLPVQMAHDRKPPKGYVECFSPNMSFTHKHAAVRQRPTELTGEKIVQCEQEFAALITQGLPGPGTTPAPSASAAPPTPLPTEPPR
jgi:arabinofuranosyltransferase